jgi:hypothetical protein
LGEGATLNKNPTEVGLEAGLPDGIISNQKSQFGSISEGLAMEDVCMYTFWPFGLFYGHFVYFVGHFV